MARTTTAHLPDGRHVVVPASDVRRWMDDVNDGQTSYGLADWYTKRGQAHQDEIQGLVDDHARCDHRDGPTVLVTSPAQVRMVRVCGRRACVLDAMAWVERSLTVDERATWRDGAGVHHVTAPDADVDPAAPAAKAPVRTELALSEVQAVIDDPARGVVGLVGSSGGVSRIVGSIEDSSLMMGALAVETEHGTVYLEPEETVQIEESF